MDCAARCSSSSSRKRKQPDPDEEESEKLVPLEEVYVENEYEHLDSDDDNGDDKPQETVVKQALNAQEKETITQYDDIKITPFNLKEELEEGEFDKQGNFIYREKSPTNEDNDDTWEKTIDWSAVEKKERELKERRKADSTKKRVEDHQAPELKIDKLSCYKKMLRIMRSDETVQKSIKRLGDCIPRRRPKNSKSREVGDSTQISEAREKLNSLIELAHNRIEDGEMDIYQKSFEDLEEAIN